ncbi:hypothetical protein P0082_00405 [Candidatus Haliotispira prima]|uniref:Uncharacterized protein n=1 Tax=Candidatus Haliotispira prima TaxID=3034016 RepID=A0ABY8MHA6_9SPIO|nr:hypothetical protein P0082_00405 [Candidatus Haliotispira prima]
MNTFALVWVRFCPHNVLKNIMIKMYTTEMDFASMERGKPAEAPGKNRRKPRPLGVFADLAVANGGMMLVIAGTGLLEIIVLQRIGMT